MQHLSQRRLIHSIAAAFVLTAGFISQEASAQKSTGNTSSTVSLTQSINVQTQNEVILPDGRVVYNIADQGAKYPGDLQSFLVANLRYPEAASKQKIEGRAVVKFIVASDGSVSDMEIVKSSGNKLLDDEAIRVTGIMEKWKPAMKNGYPVAVFYHLPISYQLD